MKRAGPLQFLSELEGGLKTTNFEGEGESVVVNAEV
jgi:hypothetical protein